MGSIPVEIIAKKIYLIRGQKVMLDSDLAELYGVQTYRLNEQVKRNRARFPEDFMFQLSNEEFRNLISQIAISSWGGKRKATFVFTEHGVAMLSMALKSDKAIQITRTCRKEADRVQAVVSRSQNATLKISLPAKPQEQFV
ncbi:MAG: ORF6N domain-containing protein [Spirochaetia bacterium]|nr:ORF6N domain-containing protein [Spirochaetia bacterium]